VPTEHLIKKKMAAKGGGTRKVCLPYAKYKSLSKAQKDKLIRSKKSVASKGGRVRSRKTFIKGTRKKGATLRDWFGKERWVNIATGEPCGASRKKKR